MAIPIIGALIPILGEVLDRVIPDPTERAKLQLELAKLADADNQRAHLEALAQTGVNRQEAAHRSIFVAGWRPAVGWVCAGSLVYATIIAPLTGAGAPDLGFLQTILLAMLGISASRTYEKVKGVTNDILPIIKPKADTAAPSITPIATPTVKPKKKGLDLWPF